MGVDCRLIRVGARAWGPVTARAAFAACVACALLLGLGLARAEAAPGWLPATNLSTPLRDASNVSVAMDDAGGAIAVWQRSGFPTHPVQVAIKGAGTGFGGPIDLSATGGNPFMAMSRTGTAVVAYQQLVGGKNMVRIHLRSPGGDFSGPIDVAETAPGGASVRPKVAVNPAGDVAVAWRDRLPIGEEEGKTVYSEGFVIRVSVKPAGGAFSAPFDLSDVEHTSDNPQVAVRDDGEVTVAWSGYTDSEDKLIQVAEGAAGGFSEPVEVSSADEANDPQLALDPSGEPALLWRAREIVGEDEDEKPIFSPPALEASVGSGGTFTAPVMLSDPAYVAQTPRLSIGAGGQGLAVWSTFEEGEYFVRASARPPGGAFGPRFDLTEEDEVARQPRVVVNGSGVATVAWQDERADRVRALRWSAGGGAGEHVDVSAAGGQTALGEVAMDAAGDAVAVWRRDEGADAIAQAAGYDAAGPSIRGLSVPPTATVGEPVAFAVDPFDVWSIAAAGFDFGDGTSAPGTSTSHVYGAPGAYLVTAVATDPTGSSTSAAGTIAVAPSYAFRIGKRKRVKRRGIMLLGVDVSGPGRVFVNGRLVKRRVRRAASAKRVWIPVIARGKALKRLRKRGKSRVAAFVSFLPNGGTHAARRRLVLVLVEKPGRGKSKHRRTSR